MAQVTNSFNGGSHGTTITVGNSGGSSGNAFDHVDKGTGAYLDYDNSPVHSGPYSARFHTGATAATAYVRYETGTLGSLTTVYGRVYFYCGEAPQNAFNLIRVRNSGGTTLASIEFGADRKFRTREGDAGGFTVIATSPTAMPLNQWVRLEFKFIISTTSGHVRLYVYENPESGTHTYTLTDSNNRNTGSGSIGRYELGVTNSKAETGWFRLDDIEWDSASYPGALPPPDPTAPSVPTNLSATAVSQTQINLAWTASTDNVGVAGYRVYRDGAGTPLGEVAGTSYQDTQVGPSEAHTYKVSAFDAANNESAQSVQAGATTPAPAAITLDVQDFSNTEGSGGAGVTKDFNVTVSLSSPATQDVRFEYYTGDIDGENGTATAGTDYRSKSSVRTILAGSTSTTIRMEVYGDTGVESDKTFFAKIKNPRLTDGVTVHPEVTIGRNKATVTIINDDTVTPPPSTLQVMHGFYQGDGTSADLTTTENGLGKDFGAFRAYVKGLQLPSAGMYEAANVKTTTPAHGTRLMVFSSNNKKEVNGVDVAPDNDWAQIAAGNEETYFKNLGRSLQDNIVGDEVVYCFFHEPHENLLEWHKSTDGTKGGTAMGTDYKAVMTYIHNLWRATGIAEDGHSWLRKDGTGGKILLGYSAVLPWALSGTKDGDSYVPGADNLYPGNGIIDVLCHDDYNVIGNPDHPYQQADRLFGIPAGYTPPSGVSGRSWRDCLEMCEALGKPLIIGEFGSMPVAPSTSTACKNSSNQNEMYAFTTPLKSALSALDFAPDRNGWFEQAADFIKNDALAQKWFAGFLYYHSRRWMFTTQNGLSNHPSGCISTTTGSGVEGRTGWINGFVNDSAFVGTPVPLFNSSGVSQFPRNLGGGGTGSITFVGSAGFVTEEGGTVVVPKPSGVQSGDVLVATLQGDYARLSHSVSGWTLVGWIEEDSDQGYRTTWDSWVNGALVDPPHTDLKGGNDLTGYVFVKVAGSSEPSSYTFPQSGGSASSLKYGGAITAWRGVDPSSPVVAVKWDSGTDSSPRNEIICPGVATEPGGVIICHFVCDDNETWAVPSDMTLIDAQNPDSGVRLNGGTTFILPRSGSGTSGDDTGMIVWKASPATSPSASKSVTIINPRNTSTGPNMFGYTVSLRPAP